MVRVAKDAEHPARRIDLDDVAAVLTLDDPVSDLTNEDGWRRPGLWPAGTPDPWSRGMGDGHAAGTSRVVDY